MNRRTYSFGQSNLHLEFGDITTSKAQVIVSSDDYYLSMGGGVSAAIRRTGGEAIRLDASKKVPARLADVVVTAAGSLAAQHIFHAITIGPNPDEMPAERVIETTTRRSLELLQVMRLHSIAFPAIGAGLAGFDYDDVATEMAEAIAPFLADRKEPIDVTIYLFDRFGTKTAIDYVTFFEEFRVRVPMIAAHEVESDSGTTKAEAPPNVPPSDNPDDPRVLRHRILKELASLESKRNTLEQTAVNMAALGDEQAKTRTRQALREIEDRRLECLVRLHSDKKTILKVFFSYAHEDESLRDELAKHLRILQRQGVIAGWHDRKITAGTEWEGQINSNLDRADIILLLISPDFMASDYCYDVEMKRALERHHSREARVIPLILRPVRWSGTCFAKLQALPTDGKPVTKWDDQDSAFLNVTDGIMDAVEEWNGNRKQADQFLEDAPADYNRVRRFKEHRAETAEHSRPGGTVPTARIGVARRICFDRFLPADFNAPDTAWPAILKAKRWENGSPLSVRFLEGTSEQRNLVKQFAVGWSLYANITFDFNDHDDAEIRITFDPDLGAWSYLGTDSQSIAFHEATMNLGWVDQGIILHEFGHVLGLIHEHQNPEGSMLWDRDEVIRDLSGPPNYWNLPTIENNMFHRYLRDLINGTQFDPETVMMIRIPHEWTVAKFEMAENSVLSPIDKALIGSAEFYPHT